MRRAWSAPLVLAMALTACATQKAPPPVTTSSADPTRNDVVAVPSDPFPSTYKPWPSGVTVIRGAIIYDGEGGRIDGGSVRLTNGRIDAIGGADLAVPEGAKVSREEEQTADSSN